MENSSLLMFFNKSCTGRYIFEATCHGQLPAEELPPPTILERRETFDLFQCIHLKRVYAFSSFYCNLCFKIKHVYIFSQLFLIYLTFYFIQMICIIPNV